jgi:PD-(D/E)XK nuclease superfamily
VDTLSVLIPVKSDKECLEDLVLDGDLNKLETIAAGFNIFEAIGAVRRETRHSDFLSFLLNPEENHGLHDGFLKSFLFGMAKSNRSISGISPIEIDLFDLSDCEVRREWENIDILLVSHNSKFVCAIENKIDSSEHSNQLARYEAKISAEFGGYRKLFIYLTIEGESPEKDLDWLPYSYQQIHDLLASMLLESSNQIGDEVSILLAHYVDMINRHLMSDNEVADLSRKIYQRHKKALDLIFEYRPDALTETNKHILDVLGYILEEEFVLDHCTKGYIRFAVKRWDAVDGQLSGQGQWTKSNRVVLFEIVNSAEEIAFKLIIGPGDQGLREKVFNATVGETKLFTGKSKSLYGKWTQIYKKKLVNKKQMGYEFESIKNLISQELNNIFYHGEFKKLCDFMDSLFDAN